MLASMLEDYYQVESSPDFKTFEFTSVGLRGNFTKVVHYTEVNVKGFYNLGFGDKDPVTGLLSDLIVTNNGDSRKVLATVAATLYVFMDNHPGATVIATGSTPARTRLYRMGITGNLENIEKDFAIFGLTAMEWEPFRKHITYRAFLVRRKM
jgi:hypothetical protein